MVYTLSFQFWLIGMEVPIIKGGYWRGAIHKMTMNDVRCMMYDERCTMNDVRCTMYDVR
jgi:hypothetical protein